MISAKVAGKLRTVGFSIKSNQERFVEIVKLVAVEIGGPTWQGSDLKTLWGQVTKECKEVLVNDPEGPQFSKSAFGEYMGAARKAIIFGVPFKFARKIAIEDLARVKELIDKDASDKSPEEKLNAAAKIVKDEKAAWRRLAPSPAYIKLRPATGDDGEEWFLDLFDKLRELLNTPDALEIAQSSKLKPMIHRLRLVCSSAKRQAVT
jgi:hypothetical protein